MTIPAQEEKVQQDLSQLTRKEKLDLVRKESPELLELVEDYKVKVSRTDILCYKSVNVL